MAGTIAGGKQTAITNKARYGEDYYARLGKIGGTKSRKGGFYNNPELASRAGRIGGRKSRRGANKVVEQEPKKSLWSRLFSFRKES